jgi:hypothetical protein
MLRKRQRTPNVQAADIANAIRTSSGAIEQEQSRFRLEGGIGLDGEPLTVVVREVQSGILVVTVF